RVGGYDLDEAVTAYLREHHRMAVGSQAAEEITLAIGSAMPLPEELETAIRGRDLLTGLPREFTLTATELRSALQPALTEILTNIHATLEDTPPELAGDITRYGILLAGGGSLLHGLLDRVHAETGMPVTMADDPLGVVAGAAAACQRGDSGERGRRRDGMKTSVKMHAQCILPAPCPVKRSASAVSEGRSRRARHDSLRQRRSCSRVPRRSSGTGASGS